MSKLDQFTIDYITCALWSSTDQADDQGGNPLDHNYSLEDIAPKALERIVRDCTSFQQKYHALNISEISNKNSPGHDFWLTRNRHGAGFWDGDYPKDIGETLAELSHSFGECDLYVGDDKKLHLA
jgi:hypothetical protein